MHATYEALAVLGDVDWTNLQIAGALIVGAVAAVIATIRVTRFLLQYLRREQNDKD